MLGVSEISEIVDYSVADARTMDVGLSETYVIDRENLGVFYATRTSFQVGEY